MQEIKRQIVAVFCGSKTGNNPVFAEDAGTLGKLLALSSFDIVYGGSEKGLMGALANNALANGSNVTGVMPEVLVAWEQQHKGLTDLIITSDMHERKRTMYLMADAAIVLPGGFGTLDEMFEMLTWNQLSIHSKKIFILNTDGFYTHLKEHVDMMSRKGFLYDLPTNRLAIHATPETLIEELVNG